MSQIYNMNLSGTPILKLIQTGRYVLKTHGVNALKRWMDKSVPEQLKRQVSELI